MTSDGGPRGTGPASTGHGHDGPHAHADVVFDQAFWDERYRSATALWSGDPNPVLVAEAAGLDSGTALDVGCGEGADAVWLARHGWQVTAVDISGVALERGAGHARERGPGIARRITWCRVDLTDDAPLDGRYDLVTAQFMQLPGEQRARLHHRLAAVVAPGGTLLVVGHHPSDMATTVPRPPLPDLYFTASDVAASLGQGWTILVDEARARPTLDPDGRPTTIHDAVLKARRDGP